MPSRWDGPAYISDTEGTPLNGVLVSTNDGRVYHIASHAGNSTLPGDWLEVANPTGGDGEMGIKSNAMCVFTSNDRSVAQVASITATLPVNQRKRYPSINFVLGAYDLAGGARNMRITAIYTDNSESVLYSFPTDAQKHGPVIRDGASDVIPPGIFSVIRTFTKVYNIGSGAVGGLSLESGSLFEFKTPLALDAQKTLKAIRLEDTNPILDWNARGLAIFGATASEPPPEVGAEVILQ